MATGGIGRARLKPDGAIKVKGDTDDTLIGNVGDRLKVDAALNVIPQQKVVYMTEPFLNAGSKAMNVDGSSVNVTFSQGPPAGQIWYINRLNFLMDDSGQHSSNNFGAIAGPLTNGVLVEQVITSTNYELMVLDNNTEISERFNQNNLRGAANQFLNSVTFFTGDFVFPKEITLVGDNSDKLQAVIRDDLTGLDKMEMSIDAFRVIT